MPYEQQPEDMRSCVEYFLPIASKEQQQCQAAKQTTALALTCPTWQQFVHIIILYLVIKMFNCLYVCAFKQTRQQQQICF